MVVVVVIVVVVVSSPIQQYVLSSQLPSRLKHPFAPVQNTSLPEHTWASLLLQSQYCWLQQTPSLPSPTPSQMSLQSIGVSVVVVVIVVDDVVIVVVVIVVVEVVTVVGLVVVVDVVVAGQHLSS